MSLSTAGPPSNTWFFGPIQGHSPNSKSIGSAVSVQLTAESAYTLQWGSHSPKIAPSCGDGDPHLFHDSLRQTEPTIQTASGSVWLFLHRWPQSVPILYNGTPIPPLKIAPPMAEIWTPI